MELSGKNGKLVDQHTQNIPLMKKNIITFLICFMGAFSYSQSVETNTVSPEQTFQNEELFLEQEGIRVYYFETKQGANRMLSIRFVNTSEEFKSFTWSIRGKYGIIQGGSPVELKPGKAIIERNILELKGAQVDYPITITIQ